MSSRRYILTLACPDRVGIVAAVSGFFAEHKGWIVEAHNHADPEAKRFFMRLEILAESLHDGTIEHIQNFLDCVRTRKTPNAPVEAGFEAARTSWIGNLALKAGKKLTWNGEEELPA